MLTKTVPLGKNGVSHQTEYSEYGRAGADNCPKWQSSMLLDRIPIKLTSTEVEKNSGAILGINEVTANPEMTMNIVGATFESTLLQETEIE